MSVVRGLIASFNHEDNGMALKDMKACQSVAKLVVLFVDPRQDF
jgi:hypothetical protein